MVFIPTNTWNWDDSKFGDNVEMVDEDKIKGSKYKSAIGNIGFYSGIHEWRLSELGSVFTGIITSGDFDFKNEGFLYNNKKSYTF